MALMNADPAMLERVKSHVDRGRLLKTAEALIEVPSPTGSAKAAADRLAQILERDGFKVERPSGGYPAAPAVAVRLEGAKAGPTLQFNGHLDTVHLPFTPPRIEGSLLTGSGASDMKGGIAAAVEALRAVRDACCLEAGALLLTAHDLHEAPWGDGRQLNQLIREGLHGDAVLLPEPLCDVLPVAGRGSATWKVVIRRAGAAVHEVMRPRDEPSVILAAASLVERLSQLDSELGYPRSSHLWRGQRVHRADSFRRDLQSVPARGMARGHKAVAAGGRPSGRGDGIPCHARRARGRHGNHDIVRLDDDP